MPYRIFNTKKEVTIELDDISHDELINEIQERISLRHGEARKDLINKFRDAIGNVAEDGKKKDNASTLLGLSVLDIAKEAFAKGVVKGLYRKAFDAGYDLSSSRRVIIESAADYEREYNAWFEKHWEAKS